MCKVAVHSGKFKDHMFSKKISVLLSKGHYKQQGYQQLWWVLIWAIRAVSQGSIAQGGV